MLLASFLHWQQLQQLPLHLHESAQPFISHFSTGGVSEDQFIDNNNPTPF